MGRLTKPVFDALKNRVYKLEGDRLTSLKEYFRKENPNEGDYVEKYDIWHFESWGLNKGVEDCSNEYIYSVNIFLKPGTTLWNACRRFYYLLGVYKEDGVNIDERILNNQITQEEAQTHLEI